MNGDLVVHPYADPPWLPPAARADVLVASTADAPMPTCLVRLLIIDPGAPVVEPVETTSVPTQHHARIHVVPRTGGRPGVDLPTEDVRPGELPVAAATRLSELVLGTPVPVELVGYVRNIVACPAADYDWPVPTAHFAVYRPIAATPPRDVGAWVAQADWADELGERHWYPLIRRAGPLIPTRPDLV
ncbi:MAG: hypothetical protein ACRDPS_17035 [Nocardioides sp.]|uniref:hypothetical protein n=1 Tax=Nocardioides sp. TaxID=35761 RepID=UPI003D6B5762